MFQFDPHLLLDEPASALDELKSKKMEDLERLAEEVPDEPGSASHDSRQSERLGMRCWNWEQFPDAFGTRLPISSGSYLVLSGFQVLPVPVYDLLLLLSLLLRLQLERSMGIAALGWWRAVARIVMDWIFPAASMILLMAVVMASIAAASASSRPKRHIYIYWNCLISILASSFCFRAVEFSS